MTAQVMYLEGRKGVEPDKAKALRLLKHAHALTGHPPAAHVLGVMYQNGDGVNSERHF